MKSNNNPNTLAPKGLVLRGADAGYIAASNATDAALVHIANGNEEGAYYAARLAASVMIAPHLYL